MSGRYFPNEKKKVIKEETIEALMHKSATQQKQNSSTIADYKIKSVEYANR